ncbi:uncharacterized protein LOC125942897 [Dermacentor silvarum]|uniref:uncharacterized protein LOC125942897 n=1 Tax=Dermacentor silvarum TaxID=543639 RepID=UPI00210140DE|nr:uncharacterized protein LOC125942897 [Dermacentor silvarum]
MVKCMLSSANKKSKKKQRTFLSTEGNFCGINLNARSIVNKLRDLQSILMAPKPHVIVITETWLLSSISDLEIILPGYKIYRNTEIIEEVELLCCTNHYKFKYYPISRGIECIIVKVFLDYFPLVIAGFYRPLKCDIYFDNLIEFLGIFLDSDMHWKTRIKQLCSKLACGCYILLKACESFEYPVLRILYFFFIQSRISYCIDSRGNTFITYLDPVFRLQKRALRMITSSRCTQSSTYLYSSLHVLPVHALYELKIAEVIHSIIETNDSLPITLFKIPLRNTRAATQCLNQCFNLPPCNLYGKRLMEFNSALIWNSLPIHMKEAHNFRSAVRKYFF